MTERERELQEALRDAVWRLQWTKQEPSVIAALWRKVRGA
jgi:hypothetical protein